jgi:2-polyprenyl-3-methyl-5-hydroxy-6-metoxy-1,4-benzoquinol methylase
VEESFDERARTWDEDPAKRERAIAAGAAIRDAVPLHADMRLFEYGAGTGLLSQELAPMVGSLTLADPSAGMREVMEAKVATGVLPGARVLDLDLATDRAPDERFDVVVASMVLHHIFDLAPVLRGFADLLDVDGLLCIVDLEQEDGSFHSDGFDGHDGFDRDELSSWLTGAGFGATSFRVCHEIERNGRVYPMFLATCRREAR